MEERKPSGERHGVGKKGGRDKVGRKEKKQGGEEGMKLE